MDNQNKLALWAILNRSALDLRIKELSWLKDFCRELQNFDVEVSVSGKNYRGTGYSQSEQRAFEIALTEALERFAFSSCEEYRFGGVAGHPEAERAKNAAVCELVERDSFLCHFYTGTPFLEPINPPAFFEPLLDYCQSQGVLIATRTLCTPRGFEGVVTVALGTRAIRPFGVVVGLGCKSEKQWGGVRAAARNAATESSLFECLRNVISWLQFASESSLSRQDFDLIQSHQPAHHRSLYRTPGLETNILPLLREPLTQPLTPLSIDGVSLIELKFPETSIGKPPLYFFGAHAESSVPMTWGNPLFSEHSVERLRQFAGRDLTVQDLRNDPHPLG